MNDSTDALVDAAKRPYHGTTLARFGDAVQVTLGCTTGDTLDADPQGVQWHDDNGDGLY
ncbi:MAG: hypothetical protein WD602_00465 [Actinomycetota bacterium]